MSDQQIFTATSAYSLTFVAAIGFLANSASKTLLPRNAPRQDKLTFIWLVRQYHARKSGGALILEGAQAFDAMIHFTLEGAFVYLSTFGRSVNTSTGVFSEMCASPCRPFFSLIRPIFPGREYTRADARWGVSDPGVVSLEILMVLGAAPLCCYILRQLVNGDPARHYWIVVLCTAELYGG